MTVQWLKLLGTNSSSSCEPWTVPVAARCKYIFDHADVCQPDDGLLPYLELHFCYFTSWPWVSVGLLLCWILVLFMIMMTVSERFFCPALEIISDYLKLPANVAGATLLSMGNGANDVFTQIAAASQGNPAALEMALGEPIGGGVFVSNVVFGAIILLSKANQVTIRPVPFMKDLLFYLCALLMMMAILWDSKVTLLETVALLVYYVFYVALTLWLARNEEPVHADHHEQPPAHESECESEEEEDMIDEEDGLRYVRDSLTAPLINPMPSFDNHPPSSPLHDKAPQPALALPPAPTLSPTPDFTPLPREPTFRDTQNLIGDPAAAQPYHPPTPQDLAPTINADPSPLHATSPDPSASSPLNAHPINFNHSPAQSSLNFKSRSPSPPHSPRSLHFHAPLSPDPPSSHLSSPTTHPSSPRFSQLTIKKSPPSPAPATDSLSPHGIHHTWPLHNIHSHQALLNSPPLTPGQIRHCSPSHSWTTTWTALEGGRFSRLGTPRAGVQRKNTPSWLTVRGGGHKPSWWRRFLNDPFFALLCSVMPRVSTHGHAYWKGYATLLPLTSPLFVAFCLSRYDLHLRHYVYGALVGLLGSAFIWALYPSHGHRLLGIFTLLSFISSILCINKSADELVKACCALGRIAGLPPALMGATVLAWGNSLPDLVADVAMARDGFPSIALTGCFGSPLFQMLGGVSTSFMLPARHGPVKLHIGRPLWFMYMAGAGCLGVAAVVVPLLGFKLTRSVGWMALTMYALVQAVYLYLMFH